MAAKESSDRSKTSKTARVMNLLSKKQDPAPETGEAPAAAGSAPVPPILGSLAPDAAVSGEIKSALEAALEEELAPAPAPAAAPQATPPAPKAAAPAPQASAPAAEPPAAPAAPAPAPADPEPVRDAAPSAPAEPHVFPECSDPAVSAVPFSPIMPNVITSAPVHQATAGYINVMEVLVAEKVEKYVKLMGMCTCQRCIDDLMALTLNHLPPKYVVMSEGDRIPKLTFYEGHYNSEITAQLMKACKVVSDRPHHSR